MRQPRPSRIALLGEFGRGNFGNDASLLAAVAELRAHDPSVELSCLCNAPEAASKRYGLPATGVRSRSPYERSRRSSPFRRAVRRAADFVRVLRLMRELDAVVVPGMGVLEAGPARAGSSPSEFLMIAVAARLTGTRFVLVSVGADRVDRPLTRLTLRWALRLAYYRSFRDTHSQSCVVRYGAPCADDPVVPDVVFGRDFPAGPSTQPGVGERGSVGVGVIAYRATFYGHEPARRDAIAARYVDDVTSFVGWLLDRGRQVTLLTGDTKDTEVAEHIQGQFGDERVGIARSETFDDLLERMQELDLVIGSRYHNLVAAALTGTPVLSINYLPKNGELMSSMGLGRFHQPLEELDGVRLREQFSDLEEAADEVSRMLIAKRAEYRVLVAKQWSVLLSRLIGAAPRTVGEVADDRAAAS